ncbi:MAG: hypothetical protein A2V66_17790 [Ignavibacteria bacterium RBG_13_36_8]|nr:MAG: hypothetical protein A2V66_17790 [Ignavibacteria bacterium RBG_13_36_8]
MAEVIWDNSLLIGVGLIDDQHKIWIDKFNKLASAVECRQGPYQISQTLSFLIDYTDLHFSTEEKHMAASSYHGLAAHKKKHDDLKDTLNELVRDYNEEGAYNALADHINNFLAKWLIDHIKQTDQKFGAFLREKKIEIKE